MPGLLPPLVTKLAESESSPLVVHLLLVLAQLALINTNQLVDCLAAQPAPGMPHCTWHGLARPFAVTFSHTSRQQRIRLVI